MTISEFIKLCRKAGLARYLFDSGGSIIGLLDWNGNALDGSPPAFTWATKPALGASGYVNTVILITDLHSRGSSGGSLWMNTAGGYILVSSPPNVTWSQISSASWFGTSGGAIDNASWHGLRLRLTDYFVGGADIIHDGTRWRLAAGRAILKNYAESALSSVAINQTDSVIAFATWPVGLYADGDRINIHATGKKSGAVDTVIVRLGYSTSATVFDVASILATTASLLTTTVDNFSSNFSVARKSNTIMKVRGPNTFNSQGGTTANDLASDTTVSNLDTTAGYLLLACTTVANETFLPVSFIAELQTCG